MACLGFLTFVFPLGAVILANNILHQPLEGVSITHHSKKFLKFIKYKVKEPASYTNTFKLYKLYKLSNSPTLVKHPASAGWQSNASYLASLLRAGFITKQQTKSPAKAGYMRIVGSLSTHPDESGC